MNNGRRHRSDGECGKKGKTMETMLITLTFFAPMALIVGTDLFGRLTAEAA